MSQSPEDTSSWKCRGCGCTNDRACPGGCAWVEKDLCDRCVAYSDNFTLKEAWVIWSSLFEANKAGLLPQNHLAVCRSLVSKIPKLTNLESKFVPVRVRQVKSPPAASKAPVHKPRPPRPRSARPKPKDRNAIPRRNRP